jgi:N-acetylmuramoyl-L-alanine amidase
MGREYTGRKGGRQLPLPPVGSLFNYLSPMTLPSIRAALALPLAAAIACGGSLPSPVTTPAASLPRTAAPPLPPVPAVDGPLAIRVVYPSPNQVITSRDSNFIFGSVGSGRATVLVNGVPARVYPNGAWIAWLANPAGSPASGYEIVATKGTETARVVHPIRYPVRGAAPALAAATPDSARTTKPENLPTSRADTLAALGARLDSLRTRLTRDEVVGYVQLGQPSAADTDRTVVGRPVPGGTYKWFFLPGTVMPLVGRAEGTYRLRLDRDLDVYVDSTEATLLPADTPAPRRVTSNMKVRGSAQGVDVLIPTGTRAPYFVEETERGLVVTLYGVRANTDLVNYAAGDSMIRAIDWAQDSNERSRVTVSLRSAPYGYLVVWEGNAMVLKLRGRPAIDHNHPLAGLTIAVDPGHPPIGATGPTGLWEPRVTLPISERLRQILVERGARVVMTRTTDSAVALGDRPVIARRANAHAFVSIHLNAYGDGTNPFVAPGTGTYFFRTHSEPLAREVQRGMVNRMGLMDLGINYDNLAVVRGTWYPAVLCEGAFLMLPDQEAALRTPEFQDRYARGVADGLEAYFRALPSR